MSPGASLVLWALLWAWFGGAVAMLGCLAAAAKVGSLGPDDTPARLLAYCVAWPWTVIKGLRGLDQ